ncbi:MAG: malonic semialdehyde reductase [Hyphomonadaceae bacterium]
MADPINDLALHTLFRRARSYNSWKEEAVPEVMMRAIYDLAKWGPTSANGSPARFIFLPMDGKGRDKLKPHLADENVAKTMTAPWTVIIAHDLDFHEKMPDLFPHMPTAKDWFADEDHREVNAFRNGSLQSAYFLMAARAVGLDCGPLSGFDTAGVDKAFMTGARKRWRTNWICNLGHGDPEGIFDRLPRLEFDEACAIL